MASASVLGALNIGAYAAGSDIIRVGMIGCGGRNTGAAAQALTADKGARLVAMCDIFLDRVKAVRELLRKGQGAARSWWTTTTASPASTATSR